MDNDWIHVGEKTFYDRYEGFDRLNTYIYGTDQHSKKVETYIVSTRIPHIFTKPKFSAEISINRKIDGREIPLNRVDIQLGKMPYKYVKHRDLLNAHFGTVLKISKGEKVSDSSLINMVYSSSLSNIQVKIR